MEQTNENVTAVCGRYPVLHRSVMHRSAAAFPACIFPGRRPHPERPGFPRLPEAEIFPQRDFSKATGNTTPYIHKEETSTSVSGHLGPFLPSPAAHRRTGSRYRFHPCHRFHTPAYSQTVADKTLHRALPAARSGPASPYAP